MGWSTWVIKGAPPQSRPTLRAYLEYTEMLQGHDPGEAVERLFRELKPSEHDVEALGFMLGALSSSPGRSALIAEIVTALQARASESASTAQLTVRHDDGAHLLLRSARRSDAIALEGLLRAAPDHDLIPKLQRGLVAHRKQGRWLTTQENVFAILALRAYFDRFESADPGFQARAFVGPVLAQKARYQGRQTTQTTTLVPLSYLAHERPQAVVLEKSGRGRMYYRLGLRYAPISARLWPEAQGFEVARRYQAVDDPDDVERDAQGVWHIKAGARVRVTTSMITRARRYQVALVDPLPAGLEPMQASLRGLASQPPSKPCTGCKGDEGRAVDSWFEHENLRDDRAEAFASLLDAGVYTHGLLTRATTPGDYRVPPAKAEEMYMPETFGRSGDDRVIVH